MTSLPIQTAVLQANMTVGDLEGNGARIIKAAQQQQQQQQQSAAHHAELLVTSELSLVGYPAEDLLLRPSFVAAVRERLLNLAKELPENMAVLVGAPFVENDKIYNAAVLLRGGAIEGCVFKKHLPNEGVFDEKRIFAAAEQIKPLAWGDHAIGVLICEDLWHQEVARSLKQQGALMLVAINASPYERGKLKQRINEAQARVKENNLPLLYVNQWGGQDELVFDGSSFCLSAEEDVLWQAASWEDCLAFVPDAAESRDEEEEIAMDYQALMTGIRDYVTKSGYQSVVLGLSGGLDSALTATLAVDALGASKVEVVILPSSVTSEESLRDAELMVQSLNIKSRTIPIVDVVQSCLAHFEGMDEKNLAVQNLQARVRAVLLMVLSNKTGALLLATSNKSESAVGYTTLYGDMSGALSPLKDVYKTRVRQLARYRNCYHPPRAEGARGEIIPPSILAKPPSAELIPHQKDEDDLMPYEQLDKILHGFLEENRSMEELVASGLDREATMRVRHLLLKAEYKRRQSPIGIKVTSCHLGRDRRYPIVNGGEDFL